LQTLKGHYSKETADLGRALDKQLSLAVEHANAAVESHKILDQLQMSYFDFILKEVVEINKCTDELIVMIRFELGLNTDSDALTQSSQAMHKQAKHAMDELRVVLARDF
jgi:cbb3-type cytochrome oxidase cytochrome c subunit